MNDQKNSDNTDPNSDSSLKPWLFQPGQSGNPSGKPVGTRHRATRAVQDLLEGEVESLTRKAIEQALDGNTMALKLCLDRISPILKPRSLPIQIDMPPPQNLADTARAFVMAAAAGAMEPETAAQLVSAVANIARVEEIEQLKDRIQSLERAIHHAQEI